MSQNPGQQLIEFVDFHTHRGYHELRFENVDQQIGAMNERPIMNRLIMPASAVRQAAPFVLRGPTFAELQQFISWGGHNRDPSVVQDFRDLRGNILHHVEVWDSSSRLDGPLDFTSPRDFWVQRAIKVVNTSPNAQYMHEWTFIAAPNWAKTG